MFWSLVLLIFGICFLYVLRRMRRLSASTCMVTYKPLSGFSLHHEKIHVLFPFIESTCSICWSVSNYDSSSGKWMYTKKKKEIIDLKSRSYTISNLECKTKDGATLLLDVSFNYEVIVVAIINTVQHHSDPVMETALALRQIIGGVIHRNDLRDVLKDWAAISSNCYQKLRAWVTKQDIAFNIRQVCLLSIKHRSGSSDSYNSGSADLRVINCCKHVNALKKKYPGISHSALAHILLHFSGTEETVFPHYSDDDSGEYNTSDSDDQ